MSFDHFRSENQSLRILCEDLMLSEKIKPGDVISFYYRYLLSKMLSFPNLISLFTLRHVSGVLSEMIHRQGVQRQEFIRYGRICVLMMYLNDLLSIITMIKVISKEIRMKISFSHFLLSLPSFPIDSLMTFLEIILFGDIRLNTLRKCP